ncbi:hypothetical protein [Paraburkholderia sp. HD33-4]|uniref:hypothetical protein n=1 Tax=Paraburkholderia sp. HD33-4 TaxID=2883242 RepID=UPI001F45EB7B|nr:hypothetical protein [Paraburkholderia sp. HD33-4]
MFDENLYIELDRAAVQAYNARICGTKAAENYWLHEEMGPHPYDGDIRTARVILLLANPGYDSTSTLSDHRYRAEGWPMSSLHSGAAKGMRDWVAPKVAGLVERFGAQHIAKHVCMAQIHPWASANFDEKFDCPSKAVIAALVRQAHERGAIVVAGRQYGYWDEVCGVTLSRAFFRNPTLNHSNIESRTPGIWPAICRTLEAA